MNPLGYYPRTIDNECVGDISGAAFCESCTPDHADSACPPTCCAPWTTETAEPIFRDMEADAPTHCVACGVLIPHALTAEGLRYVGQAIADGDGDPATVAAWLTEYGADARCELSHDTETQSFRVHAFAADVATVRALFPFIGYGPEYRRGVAEALTHYSRLVDRNGPGDRASAAYWLAEATDAAPIARACDGCNAEPGENCRPACLSAGEWLPGERYNAAGQWNPRLVACDFCGSYAEPDAMTATECGAMCESCTEAPAHVHAFDGTPTSEPCPGADRCPDCRDVARQTADHFAAVTE